METDPDGKQYLSFPTLPGYHYTVETSSDLESFLPASGGFFYGNGAPDGYEHSEGTDPKSATSTPLMLRVERRAVDYWYHQGPGGGASAGWAEFYQTWSLSGPEYKFKTF